MRRKVKTICEQSVIGVASQYSLSSVKQDATHPAAMKKKETDEMVVTMKRV